MRVSVRLSHAILIAIAAGIAGAANVFAQTVSPKILSEINVTSDSAPGWRPSEKQRQDVIKAAGDYLAGRDEGRYEGAYASMTDVNKRTMPFDRFVQESKTFHAQSGPLTQRTFLKVTWTKDPASAPIPGIYAAIDVASHYQNVDRHCGYVVLYQKNDGDKFGVMREESNFIDNAMARNIEQQKSRAELDRMWAKLAANCPNYDAVSAKPQ
jgi:Protein of unknown function (DUF4019)